MPHYKDGTEARVGDQVFGKLYNTPGVRAGTIVSITPGVESCNAMVGFLVAVTDEYLDTTVNRAAGAATRMAVVDDLAKADTVRARVTKPLAHGSTGEPYKLVECADYCAVNELTLVK